MFNTTLADVIQQGPSIGLVCLLCVVNLFIGLACLAGNMRLKNTVEALEIGGDETAETVIPMSPAAAPVASAPAASYEAPIENRQEIIAAVCAAVAEENGTDISAIRVVSFRKL